nr:hypothetical protein [Tanacetum cinerariifolium]
MTTLAEHMIVAGADNHPPMLEKTVYNSWQNRMLLYIKGKEHGRMMFNSIEHYHLYMVLLKWMVSLEPRLMKNSRMQRSFKTIMMLKPPILFFKVYHQKCTLLSTITMLLNKFRIELSYSCKEPNCHNKNGEWHMARQCTQPKRSMNSTWFKEKILLVKAQEAGQVLDEKQLAFLANPGVAKIQDTQTKITHNAAFQTDDLNAFYSDCDEAPCAKVVLMANLSSYDSTVISEVPISEPNQDNSMLDNCVQEMYYSEQPTFDPASDIEITSDSNIISYDKYLKETESEGV